MVVELRPYQVEMIDALATGWRQGHRSQLLVAATGVGKTVVFGAVARRTVDRGGRVLVLVHREELLQQAQHRLMADWGLESGIERAESRALCPIAQPSVVIATVQSIGRPKRLKEYPRDFFKLVVCDEAHHVTAGQYRRVHEWFSSAFAIGVTATPDRADNVKLGARYSRVAYDYPLLRGIHEGYLCPLVARTVRANIDLSRLRTRGGDFVDAELGRVMQEHAAVIEVARPLAELAGDRKTIVFGVTCTHAKALHDALNGAKPRSACYVDGETDRVLRADTLRAFEAGDFQYLCNVGIATEGYDCPPVACIAMARPTQSRGLYTQMVGRGTRTCEGKTDCLILDWTGNTGRHSLVSAVDIFAGDAPPDVVARAKKRVEEGEGVPNELLEQAKAELQAERERERLRLRSAAEVAHVRHRVETADLWGVMRQAEHYAENGVYFGRRDGPATEKQVAALARLGYTAPENLSKFSAGKLLDQLIGRMNRKLATLKQIHLLERFGVDATALSMDEASGEIDAIASNNWQVPPEGERGYGRRLVEVRQQEMRTEA